MAPFCLEIGGSLDLVSPISRLISCILERVLIIHVIMGVSTIWIIGVVDGEASTL